MSNLYETISPCKAGQGEAVVDKACAELHTVLDFLRYGISLSAKHPLFFGHGADNAQDDMWRLILGSIGLSSDCASILLHARLTVEEKALLRKQLVRRIWERVPVPYLINQASFAGLSFYVDERVLIPRSPIAELITHHFSPWIAADKVHNILDLCTGSGCIAIACQYAFPEAHVDAVDISTAALEVARMNCERHGVQDMLNLVASDCWESVPKTRYDIIVSNPPYVGDVEMAGLPKEYLHEPDMALRADNNGLSLVNTILAQAHNYLTEDGILIVEVGNSEDALIAAHPDLPFTWLEFEQGGSGVFLLTYQQLIA